MLYRVIHATRNRVRLRIREPKVLNGRGPALLEYLQARPGVRSARMNRHCRSLVVALDDRRLDCDGLFDTLDAWTDGAARATRGKAIRGRSRPETGDTGADDREAREKEEEEQPASRAWLPLALSTAAAGVGLLAEVPLAPLLLAGAAVPTFRRAAASLTRRKKLNVDVLDAAATGVMASQGQYVTCALMLWLINLGDYIRDRTMASSRRTIRKLLEGKVQKVWVLQQGKKVHVDVKELTPGDTLVAYPGEYIGADGKVFQGKATVDQASLTGESMPVTKKRGDKVYAGTVIRDGKLYIRVEKVGEGTMVSRIVSLVESAPMHDTRIENYAERYADRVVPWSFLGAGGSYLATANVNAAAGVLICDFGTGIRVSAPTAVLSAMAEAARGGILLKGGGRYIEQLSKVDTVIFDKTGTLTAGHPELTGIHPAGAGVSNDDVLALAASAEQRFTHPLAIAIDHEARRRGLSIPERDGSEYSVGLGVRAKVNGDTVCLGCKRFMDLHHVDISQVSRWVEDLENAAATPVFVAVNGHLAGVLGFADPIHPEAPEIIRALRERGIREVDMLTGDRPLVAERVAAQLGLDRYVAEAFPEEKLRFVRRLQSRGRVVAVVGDGINDSPALAQADVGIAVGNGTDVAMETAHITLVQGNLWKIPLAIDISRQAERVIEQNWKINWVSNAGAIVLSLPGLIGPVLATIISNGGAVAATLNSLRPRGYPGHGPPQSTAANAPGS